jgi:integrase
MASIRRLRDKHQVQIRRKGFPTVTKTFHRLADAKEWARMMERQADRAELGPDRKVLKDIELADLVRRYRDEVLPGNKGGEVETIMLNAFLRHPICKKTLADLSASDFASFRDDRLNGKYGKHPISPKSVKRLLSPVQHMFEVAMSEWQIPLPANPLADFKMKVTDNKRHRRLLEGEMTRLLVAGKKTQNPIVMLIVGFALETAMRRGEMLALRWRDVDLERHSATVREPKNGHSRTIPLSPAATAILRQAETLAGTEAKTKNHIVFPIAPNALLLSWNRLTKRAKLNDLHFHDLRHEAISRLFERGLTVPEVASVSGHRDMRMLLRYAHANHASIRAKLLAAE